MIAAGTCIGFHIDCATIAKGAPTVLMAFIIFVGTILVMLSAVFGRRMGYLVLAIAFFGWMMIFSAIWTFGFYSQGPTTPTNLGPRGAEPSWVTLSAGIGSPPESYAEFAKYPGKPWFAPGDEPNAEISASVQSATSGITSFLAKQANEELGIEDELSPEAVKTTDFTVTDLEFTTASDGRTNLVAAQAFYNGGGPLLNVYGYHDSGSTQRYSWMFLIGSTLGFGIHLPFLDRAERKRKAFLTGGAAPPWFGPA